jgi:hypothetical protein
MFNNRPKLPRTVTGFETQATVNGPVSYHRPLEFSPITNAVVFSVVVGSLKDTHDPFLNIKIGYAGRHRLQIMVQDPEAVEYLTSTVNLQRGDKINVSVVGAHIVPPNQEMGTVAFAAANLLITNSQCALRKTGHIDLAESQFDDTAQVPEERAA